MVSPRTPTQVPTRHPQLSEIGGSSHKVVLRRRHHSSKTVIWTDACLLGCSIISGLRERQVIYVWTSPARRTMSINDQVGRRTDDASSRRKRRASLMMMGVHLEEHASKDPGVSPLAICASPLMGGLGSNPRDEKTSGECLRAESALSKKLFMIEAVQGRSNAAAASAARRQIKRVSCFKSISRRMSGVIVRIIMSKSKPVINHITRRISV